MEAGPSLDPAGSTVVRLQSSLHEFHTYSGETVTVLRDGTMRLRRRYDVLLEGEIRGFVIDLPEPREWLQWLPHRVG